MPDAASDEPRSPRRGQPAPPDNVADIKGAESIKLKDLLPDTRNANKGTERGQQMVENSLRKFGAGRSILIDRKGRIIAGNKTVENAGAIGLDDVIVVKTDGTKLVAVQRTDLDLENDTRAQELAIADNRAGQVSLNWDTDVLKSLDCDLSQFWTTTELEALFPADEDEKNKLKNLDQDDDLRYQVIIDCSSESEQTSMLDRFEQEGLKCKPLIS